MGYTYQPFGLSYAASKPRPPGPSSFNGPPVGMDLFRDPSKAMANPLAQLQEEQKDQQGPLFNRVNVKEYLRSIADPLKLSTREQPVGPYEPQGPPMPGVSSDTPVQLPPLSVTANRPPAAPSMGMPTPPPRPEGLTSMPVPVPRPPGLGGPPPGMGGPHGDAWAPGFNDGFYGQSMGQSPLAPQGPQMAQGTPTDFPTPPEKPDELKAKQTTPGSGVNGFMSSGAPQEFSLLKLLGLG